MYGRRCLFRHDDRTLPEVAKYHYVHKLAVIGESFSHLNEESVSESNLINRLALLESTTSRRLPVFANIEKQSQFEETTKGATTDSLDDSFGDDDYLDTTRSTQNSPTASCQISDRSDSQERKGPKKSQFFKY
jgi:hypothetical protein